MESQQNKTAGSGTTISADRYDAVLFDMDGVVTRTAAVHFAAWKKTFEDLLKSRNGRKFEEFTQAEYLRYVDGKPREDGVSSWLAARKIDIPDGQPDDTTNQTKAGLAHLKDEEFLRLIHTKGVEPYETTVALIKSLRQANIKTALVTASRNGKEILRATKLQSLFDATVTGIEAAELHLHGKPSPDVFLEAAKRLSVEPERAVVVEDAEAGVESGKKGKFGLVVGVARQNNGKELLEHGADIAVRDLSDLKTDEQNGNDIRGLALSDLEVTDANWVVEYTQYDQAQEMRRESLCSLGNGKFCTRGASFESTQNKVHYPGTYVAGAYNTINLEVDNVPFEREELVNMPNWCSLGFKIEDGEWFSIDSVEILQFSQRLNIREGMFYRDVHIKDAQGRETKLSERRFVHMRYSHMAGIELTLESVNWDGKLTLRSNLDASILNGNDEIENRFKSNKHINTLNKIARDNYTSIKTITSETKVVVAMAARAVITIDGEEVGDKNRRDIIDEECIGQEWCIDVKQSAKVRLQKTCSMYTSRDRGIYEPETTALEAVEDAPPFDDMITCQVNAWRSLWRQFDLFIETSEDDSKLVPSLLLHLNSFHCLQTASPHSIDLDTGVPARGWSGEGYQGHVFWDELFVFPFINLRMPNISAALLKYRYRRLGEARKIARAYGARGACFPWQSASDGKERTPNYWWMVDKKEWIRDYTHLEIHVNGAVAYNVWQYYQVTANDDFMYSYGAEILLEIARFFATYAKHNKKHDRYEIHKVIGPDEFHNGYPDFDEPGVNNNAYTNIMAAWTLEKALELLEKLPCDHRKHLSCRLQIEDDELKLWREVSTKMYVPVMKNGVIEQFEGYEKLKEFPLSTDAKTNNETLKKLLHENSGYLNNYKISKQPDLLMLGFLFAECELAALLKKLGLPREAADLKKMAHYYIPRTANQSTLSRVALAWVLSRLKFDPEKRDRSEPSFSSFDSNELFYDALGSDYYDVAARGTAKSGIHMGAMAGTVDIVQRCYPGMYARDDVLWFDPLLPKQLIRLSFTIKYRGQSLNVDLHHGQLKVEARYSSARAVKIGCEGQIYTLESGDVKVIELTDTEPDGCI